MIDNKKCLIANIGYILSKRDKLSKNAIRDIICMADILHHIYYGRTINESFVEDKKYKFNVKLLNEILKDKRKILEMDYSIVDSYLSISDKQCMDFAIDRYEVESTEFFYKIEKE
jgi:hypothetical protein